MATESLNKACVILGAGASHDVRGDGSPERRAEFRPPLASELFDIKRHSAYWEVLQHYPGAQFLTQLLAPKISSGQISIEKALRNYAEHHDSQIREHFKYILAYLRDLIYLSSTEYTPVPSGYVELVAELLAEYPHDVLFIVLNYDNLLESALSQFDPNKLMFSDITQYVSADRNAKVVKLHGSIDWFRLIPPESPNRIDWDYQISQLNIFEQIPENAILVNGRVQYLRNWIENDSLLYPILTAPLAGKGPTDAVCPASHIKVAREFIAECRKFLIIGTSALDEDLLDLLESAIPPESHPLVHVVDKDKGADKVCDRLVEKVRAFRTPRVTPDSTTFKDGFQGYLRNNGLRSFAKFDVG